MSVINLNSEHLDFIYALLEDERDQKALGCCSRLFRELHETNQKFRLVAKYITENYSVHATNLYSMPLWWQVKVVEALLVGENHARKHHRKKFAGLAELVFYLANWVLRVEGEKQKLGTSQIRYLKNEIAETQESWDIRVPELSGLYSRVDTALFMTSEFINMRDESNPITKLDRIEKMALALKEFGIDYAPNLEKEILKMRNLQHRLKSVIHEALFKTLISITLLNVIQKLNSFIIHEMDALDDLVAQTLLERDTHLVHSVEQDVHNGKKSLVTAGYNHVIERSGSPLNMLREKRISFLSLIPQEKEKQETSCPRSRMKEYIHIPETELNWDTIMKFLHLNPISLLREEKNTCVQDAQTFHDFVFKHHDLFNLNQQIN